MLKLKLGATIVYEARAVDIRIRVQNVKSGTANAAIAVVVAVETVIVARSARRMHSSAQAIFWARRVDHVSTVVVSSRRRNIGTGATTRNGGGGGGGGGSGGGRTGRHGSKKRPAAKPAARK